MKLDFFDCNVQVGRFGAPIPETLITPQQLADRLAMVGIRKALAFNALSKELHPAEGNPALVNEIRGLPFEQCWVALPHSTGEFPPPAEMVCRMQEAGARAIRLFPRTHGYSTSDWCIGDLLDAVDGHHIPLFIDSAETTWEATAGMLNAHPGLRLTILQTSYRCDRMLYPLMDKYQHLSIDTGSYVVTGGIESICKEFGARRLLFGTGSPFFEPGAAVAAVTYAQIHDDDKRAIAGGNLEKLLKWS